MLSEADQSTGSTGDTPKLRAACENCRQSKVKCNLGAKNTCIRCLRHGLSCRYRVANRSGKPKGSKNRATLRKLGQLPEDKPVLRGPDSGPTDKGLQVIEQRYGYGMGRMGHKTWEPESRESLSESPRSQDAHTTLHSCLPFHESANMEYASSYGDSLPPSGSDPIAAHASMSPTFLQKEFITKGLTSFPLAVHIPSAFQPTCECGEALGFHTNRLRHMVADPLQLRFDQSLQAIQAALTVCRDFLQCTSCHKDNTSLLLSVSALDYTLQLFDYWISYEFTTGGVDRLPPPGTVPVTGPLPVGYGEYEMGVEETRRVRQFLLHGRLQQTQEVLRLLKEVVELIAIITGGGQGIGAETATLFANEGAKVVIADVDHDKATQTATKINSTGDGDRALAVVGDILDDNYIETLVQRAAEFGDGKIHIIVNNAGFTWDGVIHKITDKQWDTMLAIHNTAPFKLVRAAAKYFRVKDGEPRCIINISSTSGLHGNAGQANYSLAKAGLVGLTKTITKEWGPAFGVRANTIAFGHITTRLTAAKEDGAFITTPDGTKVALGIPGKQLESRKGATAAQYPDIPLGRPGSPQEAARSVLAVASPLFAQQSRQQKNQCSVQNV
ncbi:hypothetical protein N8T08_000617 [Aspergillus melleus]|uniref:Uncharacterized protein n=1 Tax=Aspergillus melleus TaxID=138277 RepID=A0ACC3APV3_9EURO|nr:hypothetical protein N8T08_000617 [Aspergillus melleus]